MSYSKHTPIQTRLQKLEAKLGKRCGPMTDVVCHRCSAPVTRVRLGVLNRIWEWGVWLCYECWKANGESHEADS